MPFEGVSDAQDCGAIGDDEQVRLGPEPLEVQDPGLRAGEGIRPRSGVRLVAPGGLGSRLSVDDKLRRARAEVDQRLAGDTSASVPE